MSMIFSFVIIAANAVAQTPASAGPDQKFHLYLLVGQSNMAGRGAVDEESSKTDPRVLMFTKEMKWEPAKDPLHFDKPKACGVGPGLAFGKKMAEANPSVKIGLVPCAVGGTSIKVWVPGADDKATNTHPYDDMLGRIKEARKSGVFKGIIWHQGESDRNASDKYGQQLSELIERVRKDLDSPDLPFIAGELPQFKPESAASTTMFNEVVQGLNGKIKNYDCASAKDLKDKGDKLHLDAKSAREFGMRYAEKMIALQKNK
ncbi:MAG: hypothetical protein A2X45_15950 [Lentisphaerae bacterium GWF2_50_93]|nr:MAG: hypothetical protein A2X45_15950 [Lentisphaerae bacterium GWF2_50_93]